MNLRDTACLQLGNAVDSGVFRRLAVADRLDRGFFDVIGRVEIGLAGAKADDVAAGGFQRTRFIRDGDGGRRLDAHDLIRDEGHFKSPDSPVIEATAVS